MEVITADSYRYRYWKATEDFTDLSSYHAILNTIESEVVTGVDPDEYKAQLYTEIEFLKQFSTELETNADYWINLYYTSEQFTGSSGGSSVIKNNSKMSNVGSVIMNGSLNPPDLDCKIDTRGILMGAVVGGFANAIKGALVGAAGGTIAVPGFGTVTGAVAGFMVGFATGFTSGVVLGTITSLALTCGRH